jgi:hypothetical protein
MSFVKMIFLGIALTLVAHEMAQAHATTFNPEPQQVFTAVERIEDNKRAFFGFTTSVRSYTVRSDGWTDTWQDGTSSSELQNGSYP